MGKPEVKRTPEELCRWENNIKTDVNETGWGGADWSHLAQDRDQWTAHLNTVINIRIP
jgi:hypothetical protein